MKRKQIPGNMDSSPQKMSRRKALATMAGAVGLAALPGVGHALNPIKKERRDIQTSAFTSIHTMRNAVSRQFTTFDLNTKIKAHLVGPGEKSVLVDYTSPGVITRMWFTINGWFWENWDLSKERWPDPTILKMLILRIYWDGEDYPSVECPIGDFFGIGHCEYKHYMSKYIGMSSGGFYCYFPMPFKKVRIEVENLHHRLTTSVFLNANYDQLESLPEGMGRFHCLYNAGTNPGYEPLTILQTKGHGHFIGCSLSMQSWLPNYLGYLEAPEFIYIDTEDKSVPTIVGSGLEDYFNGGWYFREGEFCGELHGVPIKDPLRSMVSMYRYHEQDAICFNESFIFDFINPRKPEQTRPFKFSSAAFWYQDKAVPLAFKLPEKEKLVDWYRMRDTDHQAIP